MKGRERDSIDPIEEGMQLARRTWRRCPSCVPPSIVRWLRDGVTMRASHARKLSEWVRHQDEDLANRILAVAYPSMRRRVPYRVCVLLAVPLVLVIPSSPQRLPASTFGRALIAAGACETPAPFLYWISHEPLAIAGVPVLPGAFATS